MDVDEFLAHYGVKGMKWGERKADDKSQRREARAQKYEKKAGQHQKKADELLRRAANPKFDNNEWARETSKQLAKEALDKKAKDLKAADDIRSGKRLTDSQKKQVKGTVAVGALLAAYGGYTMVQSGEANRLRLKGRQFINGGDLWKKNDHLASLNDPDSVFDGVVKQVNPGYGKLGTKVNCRRCTFAYEMRRRGYDVSATKTTNAHGQTVLGTANALRPDEKAPLFTGKVAAIATLGKAATKPQSDANKRFAQVSDLDHRYFGARNQIGSGDGNSIFSALRKEPSGSRGELTIQGGNGFMHSIAYEVFDGKPVLFDTQSGEKYKTPTSFDKIAAKAGTFIVDSGFTRLDNVPLNENFLGRWLKDA